MKNPLHYQTTEYDCGPTSLLNAVSFLFPREDIPPEIIRNIMLYCLDCYGAEGAPGKSGTSRTAMMFLSHWLDGFGKTGKLHISSRYLTGPGVYMGDSSDIVDALRRGGVAVVRLNFEGEHYVLLTGAEDGKIFMFDPYYQEEPFPEEDVIVTMEHPMEYNRIVPYSYFNETSTGLYAMGEKDMREAVLLFNEDTKLTDEKTIEYFI
jgi:hypothetical protein